MNIFFIKSSKEHIQDNYKTELLYNYNYIVDNAIYFMIKRDNDLVGFSGLRMIEKDKGLFFIFIFKKYRNMAIGIDFLTQLIDFYGTLDIPLIYIDTKWKSWVKVLERFKDRGIEKLDKSPFNFDDDKNKTWFLKRNIYVRR
jgi:polyhydroxyalkanoate synthesis regulator protein